jgi:hypothetical protein
VTGPYEAGREGPPQRIRSLRQPRNPAQRKEGITMTQPEPGGLVQVYRPATGAAE